MVMKLLDLDILPRQSATQVKNKWAEVIRMVRKSGVVAITNHDKVEMVLLEADTYQQMTEQMQALKAREQSVLDDLAGRFNERLAALNQPGAGQKVQALLDARGKMVKSPKAGTAF